MGDYRPNGRRNERLGMKDKDRELEEIKEIQGEDTK